MTQLVGDREEVPVLIVGGSLVGLTTAVYLAQNGVKPLAVERHPGTAIHPRAGHLHLRTLELMRSVGLEDALMDLSAAKYFPNGCINEVRTLATGEIATYIPDLNGGVEEFSPSRRLFVAQDAIEPQLRSKALELGAELLYGSEVVIEGQDESGVFALIRDLETGSERHVRAQYVVAADGNRSPIRNGLGIEMEGYGDLSHSATIYFRADFRHLLGEQQLGVVYVTNDDLRGFFRFEKTGLSGFLVVNSLGDPLAPGGLDIWDSLTAERAHELVASALGDEQIDITVDDVSLWVATSNLASSYGSGRILLVGDAAHVVPPTGGFGGNTGIQDAHNLAWKLAMVVNGQAGDDLLATYEAERRPVGKFTIDQAYARFRHRTTPELLDETVPALVDEFSAEIGYRYYSDAVLTEEVDRNDRKLVAHPRQAGGAPGTRAAHFWQDQGISSLDLFGHGFTLLTGDGGSSWHSAAESVTASTGLVVSAHSAAISADELRGLYGLEPEGAALVRPDGFICWRSVGAQEAPESVLSDVLSRVLVRGDLARTSGTRLATESV